MARKKQSEEKQVNTVKKTNSSTSNFIYAVGRRRGAAARVRVYTKVKDGLSWGEYQLQKGQILVNQKPIEQYFSSLVEKSMYEEPFKLTNTLGLYGVMVKVAGGGQKGQLGATVLGISRALAKIEEKHKIILKKKGFLRVDSRIRERRKVGMGGKARRKKQSPKR